MKHQEIVFAPDYYLERVIAERQARTITWGEERVLRAIHRLGQFGRDSPSEAELMREAEASRGTVQRAKAKARRLDLLGWHRNRDPEGRLRHEKPCTYWIRFPSTPAPTRQPMREPQTQAQKESKGLQGSKRPVHTVRQAVRALGEWVQPPDFEERRLARIVAAQVAARQARQEGVGRWRSAR